MKQGVTMSQYWDKQIHQLPKDHSKKQNVEQSMTPSQCLDSQIHHVCNQQAIRPTWTAPPCHNGDAI